MPTQKHCGIHIRITIIEYFTKKNPEKKKRKGRSVTQEKIK